MSGKQKQSYPRTGDKKFQPKKGNGSSQGNSYDPDEPPRLRWGESTNIREFTKAMLRVAGDRFGIMAATVIEELKNPHLDEPDPNKFHLDNDPYGLNRDAYRDAVKARNTILVQWSLDMPKLFAYTTKYMSNESMDAVKAES